MVIRLARQLRGERFEGSQLDRVRPRVNNRRPSTISREQGLSGAGGPSCSLLFLLDEARRTTMIRLRYTLVFLLCSVIGVSAQTFRGTILGDVTDASGAVLAGATVSARNGATGLEGKTQTTTDGSYNIPELPIGTYEVSVTQSGFQTWVTRVDVSVASERRVDAQL